MADQLVRYYVSQRMAMITLDSPRNRNALSAALVSQLGAALDAAAADDQARAVLLTHEGPAFCAGVDLAEARREGMAEGTKRLVALLRQILTLPKPVVAAIDGHVRAGGVGLVGACDIAVAGPAATFAITETRLALAPAIISLTVLPRLTGRAAGRYFLTGEVFGPEVAARIGLITEMVEDVTAGAAEIMHALRQAAPRGLAETKPLLTAAMLAGFDDRAEALMRQSARLFASPDAAEGMAAVLEKRLPPWAL